MATEDQGSAKAIGGAALQLFGGGLIVMGLYFGSLDGLSNPWSIGLGGLAGGYFILSGAIRLGVGWLTRRVARRQA